MIRRLRVYKRDGLWIVSPCADRQETLFFSAFWQAAFNFAFANSWQPDPVPVIPAQRRKLFRRK